MIHVPRTAAVIGLLLAVGPLASTRAIEPHHGYHARRADVLARYYAAQRPWHGPYRSTSWGGPVALVVPPNAKFHSSYAWGVGQTEMMPLYHQFQRDYPGILQGGTAPLMPTPPWPSHTDQLGVYPVRGPW